MVALSNALAVLRRVRAGSLSPAAQPGEVCELCAETVGERHGHLVDLEHRLLMCACRGCYLLFAPEGAGGQRFRAVPERYLWFSSVRLTPPEWDSLQIPVTMAFFFVNSTLDRVAAFYPSPAGATESLLPLETWAEIVAANEPLATALPDVEAVLVRVDRDTRQGECFLVPIDACYELVGRLRSTWKGFDGGTEAHRELDEFFEQVRSRALEFQ